MSYSIVHSTVEPQPIAKPRARVNRWMLECCLTVLVVGFLVVLARPLAEGSRPLGLDHRYSVGTTTVQPLPLIIALNQNATMDNQRVRAEWLNEHADAVLILLATCGLLTLYIGRNIQQSKIKLPLIIAWWCITAQFANIFCARWIWPGMEMTWVVSAVVSLLIAFVGMVWTARSNKRSGGKKYTHAVASPWVYPGLVLFSGVGWIWLMDWAARGHINKQFVGMYQIDSIWMSFAIFTLIAGHQGQLLAGFSRLCSWLNQLSLDGVTMPNFALMFALLLWTIGIGLVVHLDMAQGHPELLAELMRVPVWLALGWILFSGLEMDDSWESTSVALALLLGIVVAGFYFDRVGSILAQIVAVTWVFSGVMWGMLRRKMDGVMSWLLPLVVLVGGTTAVMWLGLYWSPENTFHTTSPIFHKSSDSVMQWLQSAIPALSFGIGQTSWCGYSQVLSATGQCLQAGVPDSIQNDYVLFAMLTVWGWAATLVILLALFMWLKELMRSVTDTDNATFDVVLLRQWLVMGFVVTTGVQIFMRVVGTLEKIPSDGISIPMLSFGAAGLISTAIFAAMAVNVPDCTFVRNLKLVVSHGGNKTANQRWDVGRTL